MNASFFSRERAAGYDPEVLKRSTVWVCGAGALGQNVAMNLALSQVGRLLLADFDRWELHNATRSPFFPDAADRLRWGDSKAAVVAHKTRRMTSWSTSPEVLYAEKAVQALGDAPFRGADVVVSAVDNQAARDYIGHKTAQFHVSLVEGGFSGSHVNSTVLLNDTPDAPCWHCNRYESGDKNWSIQLGCTQAAKQSEALGLVPAIQSAAAYLAAWMSEATIQLLHGQTQLANQQVTANLRTGRSILAGLPCNPDCGHHDFPKRETVRLSVESEICCGEFLESLAALAPDPVVTLPQRYLVRVACAGCRRSIAVHRGGWVMTDLLHCRECGGPWDRTDQPGLEVYSSVSCDTEPLLDLPISQLGLVPGSLIDIRSRGKNFVCALESRIALPFFTTTQGDE